MLIRLITPLSLGNSLLAALLISNLALVIALWCFYRLTEAEMDSDVARRATLVPGTVSDLVLPDRRVQ